MLRDPAALSAAIVLVLFAAVTMLDSVHFRRALANAPGAAAGATTFYAPTTESLLDLVLARQIATRETGYSQPLAFKAFIKEPMERDGQSMRDFARLKFGGAHLADPDRQWAGDIAARVRGRAGRRAGGGGAGGGCSPPSCCAARTAAPAAPCATSPPTAPTSRCGRRSPPSP